MPKVIRSIVLVAAGALIASHMMGESILPTTFESTEPTAELADCIDECAGLMPLIDEFAERYAPGTAGCSNTLSFYAASILGWDQEYGADPASVSHAVSHHMSRMDPNLAEAFANNLPALTEAAKKVTQEKDVDMRTWYAVHAGELDASRTQTLFDAIREGADGFESDEALLI